MVQWSHFPVVCGRTRRKACGASALAPNQPLLKCRTIFHLLSFQPQEYLDAAVAYLDGNDTQLRVADITGIWVASDEAGVVDRVKEIAPSYLPNVNNNAIVWVSGGVEGGPTLSQTATRTDKEVKSKRRECQEM